MKRFVGRVLADTEDVMGRRVQKLRPDLYASASGLVLWRLSHRLRTGRRPDGSRSTAPTTRRSISTSPSIEELKDRFNAPGDFAQAYVIAHEVGHHVQKLLGITDKVAGAAGSAERAQANALQVRMELQADCFAGVWANHAQETEEHLEPGDIDEASTRPAQIGDDKIQKQDAGPRGAGRLHAWVLGSAREVVQAGACVGADPAVRHLQRFGSVSRHKAGSPRSRTTMPSRSQMAPTMMVAGFDLAVMQVLADRSRAVAAPAGTIVFRPGEPCEQLVLLTHGSVRVRMLSEGGREIQLYRVLPGEACVMSVACLLDDRVYQAEGICETDITGHGICKAVFRDLLSVSPAFRENVLTIQTRRIYDLIGLVDSVAFHRTEVRLATRLLERAGAGDVVQETRQRTGSRSRHGPRGGEPPAQEIRSRGRGGAGAWPHPHPRSHATAPDRRRLERIPP